MAKRPFERQGGVLSDRYRSHWGQECNALIPASRLGEVSTEEELRLARESVAQPIDRHYGALALRTQTSHEALEALLTGLRAGNKAAPMPLLAYLDDPRVRPALIDSLRTTPLDSIANVAQVVGMAGGAGAKEGLRARLRELLGDRETFADSSFFNFQAGSAATVAQALLALDPDDAGAAECLHQLLAHPCARNRRDAARCISEAFRREMKTEAMRALESSLRTLLTSTDHEAFLAAAPGLLSLETNAVVARCLQLLRETNELSCSAAGVMSRRPLAAAVPALLDWLGRHPDLQESLSIVAQLGALVPEALHRDLLRRVLADEAPSLRWRAIDDLSRSSLERSARVELAAAALADEPDPALRKALSAIVHTPEAAPLT